jgi:hypothetical protein
MNASAYFPGKIYAGETLLVGNSYQANFATPNYTISFQARNLTTGETIAPINATANGGGGWLLNVPPATTAGWNQGTWQFALQASDGNSVFTVEHGQLYVLPGVNDHSVSTVKKIVDALDAAILARMMGDAPISYSVEGMSVSKMSLNELNDMRDKYYARFLHESGKFSGGVKRVTFQFR